MLTQRRKEKRVGECMSTWERERPPALWLLFLYVFSAPWACPMYIGLARSVVCST